MLALMIILEQVTKMGLESIQNDIYIRDKHNV